MCSETSSLAGTARLSVSDDGRAELRKLLEGGGYSDEKPVEGAWDFDQAMGRYRIELGGRAKSYLLVSPPNSHTCMLIAGELGSADLRATWFAVFVDDSDYPREREPDYR